MIIPCSSLSDDLPPSGFVPVFVNPIRRPRDIECIHLLIQPYLHERQRSAAYRNKRPRGHDILGSLVESYTRPKFEDKKNQTKYPVVDSDKIHRHFGLAGLLFLWINRKKLSRHFRDWVKHQKLFGWASVMRKVCDGRLVVPGLDLGAKRKNECVAWYDLDDRWVESDPGLRTTDTAED